MNRKRYAELIKTDAKLTEDEKREGWHFCKEWDFMLIHNTYIEFDACICNLKYKDQYPQKSYKGGQNENNSSD